MPPTSSTLQSFKDVDARHEAGHDDAYLVPSLSTVMRGHDDEAQSFHVMAGLVPAIHAFDVAKL